MLCPLQSNLSAVESCAQPAFAHGGSRKGAKGRGLRYQEKAQGALELEYQGMFIPGPWFKYRLNNHPKWLYAQPDGLLFDFYRQLVVVIEMKYNHCAEAYFQMFDKYVPLVDYFLNSKEKLWDISCCEVCYWYDKYVVMPREVTLRKFPHQARPGEMAVHIWRP